MEKLAFVDEIGQTNNGYIYRLDFSEDIDCVWGEYFNVVPSVIIPNLQPDINCISSTLKVVFPRKMAIAKKNGCFSMQDCIDGILPLIFSEIDENTLKYNNQPFFLSFGDEYDSVMEKLKNIKVVELGEKNIASEKEDPIDKLIKSLDNEE